MYNVSAAYLEAINAPSREVRARAVIHFDTPLEVNDEIIIDFDLLEEAQAASIGPLGVVSANELTLTLDNSERKFTPNNEESEYYGEMKPGVKIELFTQLVLPDESVEEVPMGTYFIVDWRSPSGSLQATITALDRVHKIGERPLPQIPTLLNTTIGEMFERLFKAVGLSEEEYIIDSALNIPIKIGWYRKGRVKDALQGLCEAGVCSIVCDRQNRFLVKSFYESSASVATLADDTQIFESENPLMFTKTYDGVRMRFNTPTITRKEILLDIRDLEIPSGETLIEDIEFSSGPAAMLTSVKLLETNNSTISKITTGTWGCSIEVNNTSGPETGRLVVEGFLIDSAFSNLIQELDDDKFYIEVQNDLIQHKPAAIQYHELLNTLLEEPALFIEVSFRGNPAVELMDTITINNNANKLDGVEALPIQMRFSYDGALSCTGEFLKAGVAE